jgi:hypothetical protein
MLLGQAYERVRCSSFSSSQRPLATRHHHAARAGVRAGTVRVFTMDSAVLGLASSGCGCCTVRVFRQEFALEDAIEFRAFAPPFEALACV